MRLTAIFPVVVSLLASSVGAWPKASCITRHGLAMVVQSAPRMITARVAANAAALHFGKSVGSPTDGHLLGGAHLDDAPYLRVLPHDVPGDVRWGLTPLVSMIDRSGRTVAKKYPGSVLEVGHLSRAGGGDVGDHASHESGRDADISFYVKNNVEKQVFSDHMVPFRGDGNAPSWPGARFDDAKNWMLVSALVQDSANVTHIFVSAPLRARLLAYAEKNGAAPAVRNRAAELMMQPHGSLPHDDHFHVRIACPPSQRECIENPAPKKKLHIAHVPVPKRRERAEPAPAHPNDVAEKSASETSKKIGDETPAENNGDVQSDVNTSAVISAPNESVEGD